MTKRKSIWLGKDFRVVYAGDLLYQDFRIIVVAITYSCNCILVPLTAEKWN